MEQLRTNPSTIKNYLDALPCPYCGLVYNCRAHAQMNLVLLLYLQSWIQTLFPFLVLWQIFLIFQIWIFRQMTPLMTLLLRTTQLPRFPHLSFRIPMIPLHYKRYREMIFNLLDMSSHLDVSAFFFFFDFLPFFSFLVFLLFLAFFDFF